ncbi:MAG: spore germination protein [Symploca sp. SIO2E6]|nr:spore germination protein [Symploca sp. SIO2E6]
MQDQKQQVHRIPLGIVVGTSALLLALGVGGSWRIWNSFKFSTTTPVTQTAEPSQLALPSAEVKVQVYWLNDVNNQIELVASSVRLDGGEEPAAVLKGAFDKLLAGPSDPGVATTIPQGTKLRRLYLKTNGIHVDLSQEFTTGGGSASMTGRLAQVLYTASSLDPEANVWVEVEGERLDVLGGEGLLLEQPLTREDFEQNFDL